MCGRYVMARAVGDLLAEFDAELEDEVSVPPSWNVAPTDAVPIVLERLKEDNAGPRQVRQLHVARWGLVPSWAKDLKIGSSMINARSESVLEKPAFRKAVKSRRCAVPADGYYEWKQGPGKSKQPYYVHPVQGNGLVFAGLYEWWKDLSVPVGQPGRWLLSTSILTADTPPPGTESTIFGKLAELHDRVPLPMDKATMEAWLDPRADDAAGLVDLVRSRVKDAAADWQVDSVGKDVGNVRNNGPELIRPAEALFQQPL
ncbi:SOS response-associated peptidase [Arthrobacter sp. FW306-05-C]|uniref:SOS response-associated peptidase n=2 Tax=Arthrobacter TaxID=1663 RepID=UPI00278868BF|nr:SOS response-associated peptidase [Arthrobacter oryzae]MDP9986577.1 putative SOS response-associated peptidase YedK [Arthrobacter oryzae]UKA65080.1 SOS response-associated peptidase [Arthrobacter sp. FW306-05-C]UKA69384.1 SOS response-associated peptidase [Arthrobacter sp. FW306-06-A]UKA73752.1 SOS response-associated peptidase [Arthrobacter sp. FW306-07-I]